MSTFHPTGAEAKWVPIYKHVEHLPFGTTIPFEELNEVAKGNVQNGMRGLVYQANKRLLKDRRKMLISVRKVGYQVADPEHQLDHAETRKLRGTRQIKKGIIEATNLDSKKLSPERDQHRIHFINHMAGILTATRKRVDSGIRKAEESVKEQKVALNQLEEMQRMINEMRGKFQQASA